MLAALLAALLQHQPAEGAGISDDADFLLEFKESLSNGDQVLADWGGSESPCKWTGVTCDAEGSKVTKLCVLHAPPPRFAFRCSSPSTPLCAFTSLPRGPQPACMAFPLQVPPPAGPPGAAARGWLGTAALPGGI